MRRTVSVVLTGCVVSVFFACGEDGDTIRGGSAAPPAEGSDVVRFSPSCGSPGDVIDVRVGKKREARNVADATCTAEDEFVSFFTPSVESKPSAVQSSGDDCSLTVTVPEGATTGKIRTRRRAPPLAEGLNQESDDVFTIPCPVDAGPDSPATAPLGGVVSVSSPETGTGFASGAFFGEAKALTPAQIAALAYEELRLLSRIAPYWLAMGTCGNATPPGGEPAVGDKPATVSVGDVVLRLGGSPLVTLAPQTARTETIYDGNVPNAARDAFIELFLSGAGAFAPTTLPDAMRAPPAFSILTPDVSSTVAVAQGSPLTITYPTLPGPNVHVVIDLARISTGETTTCVMPPDAGTFTVPAATLGAAGNLAATVRAGYVTEATKDNRRYVFTTAAPIDFLINVQ